MKSDRNRDYSGNDQPESDDEVESSQSTRQLPAVDPDAASTESTAPPVDVDDRDPATHHPEPPDVIELPDHTEPAEPTEAGPATDDDFPEYEPEEATGESPDAAIEDLKDEWQSDTYVDPETEDDPGDESATAADLASAEMSGYSVTGVDAEASESLDAPASETGDRAAPIRFNVLRAKPETHSDAGDPLVHEAMVTGSAEDGLRRDGAHGSSASESLGRVLGPFQTFIAPPLDLKWTTIHRLVLLGGALLILLALLASSAGIALIIASAIVSVLIVLTLSRQDLFEHESTLLVLGVGILGGLIGIVIGTLGSWLTSSNWFDSGQLNYGAAGFGGRFADLAGGAPFSVWFLNGLILPLIALAAIAAAPIALRRLPQFRNEVMDGVILVGASAAGFTIGTALVYWSPMLGDRGPQTSVGDWTLMSIGVILLRPVVITLSGAMLGAGIWRYMVTPALSRIIIPAMGSIGAFLLLTFGSIQLQPTGLWPEVIWTLLVAAAAFVIYRIVLKDAVATDRSTLGETSGRMVCPTCGRITPAGAFCANCGEPLSDSNATPDAGGVSSSASET